jgi:hypothetical protein
LGNGTLSTASTTQGVYLRGQNNAGTNTGIGAASPVTIVYGGGASGGTLIQVAGSIGGWGLENLTFDGGSLMTDGVRIVAAVNGNMKNCTFNNFKGKNIYLYAYPPGGTGARGNQFNTFNNITVNIANFANATGLYIDGDNTGLASNSSFNTFSNVLVKFPLVATSMFGFFMRGADTNTFNCTSCYGGGAGTIGIVFDYTSTGASGALPSNNVFLGFDSSPQNFGGLSYANSGSVGNGARPNRFYGVSDINGEVYPKLSNAAYNAEFVTPGVSLTGQTAGIGVTNVNPIPLYATGMYRINWYLETTTVGSGGSTSIQFFWTDDAQAQASGALGNILATSKTFANGAIVVRAQAGTNITFGTGFTGTGGAQYAFFVRLEKLD